jgi:hypothetical protein
MVQLPQLGTPHEVRGGRVVHEGYQRGWGLQFNHLAAQVAADPLYQAALAASPQSLLTSEKRMNIFLLVTEYLPRLAQHDIIEFGAYKGGNAMFMAKILKERLPHARVFALDTFAGMPRTDSRYDMHGEGDFGDARLEDIAAQANAQGLDNIVWLKGLFDETFPGLSAERFGLAHIDCDIFHSAKYCQDAVWPQMADGGYLVYDDADVSSCIGATEAAEQLMMARNVHSEQVWPHWVFRTFK